jgi:cytoskeletal protein CcmA (bactofilin family)
MGSLSNLYVSQSYQSLLHLGTDTSFFPVGATAPQGFITVQDGLGYNAGFAISSSGDMFFSQSVTVDKNLSVNQNLDVDGNFIVSGTFDIEGKVTINDNVRVNGNLEVSGATTLTGSLVVSNAITASNMFLSNDLIVSGTLFANKIVTLIESSSIIFSSGSNILGDSILDTQTLNGTTIMSGSSSLTGSMGITGDLNVLGNISSSTISGIGNVTLYSASVNSRLVFLEGPFSTSVDLRLDQLEAFSSSLQTNFVTTVELTQTASFLQNQIDQKLFTSSFNAYSSSIYNGVQVDGSLTRIKGGLQITGSMNITGSMIYSGSVRGVVIPLTITSQTASMDCSLGNFFTLTLVSGSNTMLTATNIQPGETIGLRVTQPATNGTLTYTSVLKFPQAFPYIATPISGAVDILSFQSYDTTELYGVGVNTMI